MNGCKGLSLSHMKEEGRGQPHSSNVSMVEWRLRSEPLGLEGWSRSVRLLVLLEALDIWSQRRGDMPAIDGVLGRLCSEKSTSSCDDLPG